MTPKGHYNSILSHFTTFARHGNIVAFDAYVNSEEFTGHMAAAGARFRQMILKAHKTTRAKCERLAIVCGRHPEHPVTAPPAAREGRGVSWKAPGMLERLRAVYAKARDDEEAARLLGVSKGAARLARRTYLDAATTGA